MGSTGLTPGSTPVSSPPNTGHDGQKESTITATASTSGRATPERMVFSHPQTETPRDGRDQTADAKPPRDALFSDPVEPPIQTRRSA